MINVFEPKEIGWRGRGFKVAKFCHRCRHLIPRKSDYYDPWEYRCDIPFVTLTMARESKGCKFFEDKHVVSKTLHKSIDKGGEG
ncbi:unnamed protein product [marine sediment metagenome]|uniref:Uncharacterized protein n=1 Tax=marine sediment metagenome TaxID=412755 RepID=X1VDT8_9ZZZZ